MQFKIIHWNCLADSLSDAFPKVDPKYLEWSYRKPSIISRIDKNHMGKFMEEYQDEEIIKKYLDRWELFLKVKNIEELYFQIGEQFGEWISPDDANSTYSILDFDAEDFDKINELKVKFIECLIHGKFKKFDKNEYFGTLMIKNCKIGKYI